MQNLLFTAVGILLLVLENLFRMKIAIHRTGPELAFLLVIFLGLTQRTFRGALFAFILGFCQDSLTGPMPGLFAGSYVLAFFSVDLVGNMFYPRSLLFQLIAVVILSALTFLIRSSCLHFFSLTGATFREMLALLPWQVLLNAGAAVIVLPIFQALADATDPEKKKDLFSSRSW